MTLSAVCEFGQSGSDTDVQSLQEECVLHSVTAATECVTCVCVCVPVCMRTCHVEETNYVIYCIVCVYLLYKCIHVLNAVPAKCWVLVELVLSCQNAVLL